MAPTGLFDAAGREAVRALCDRLGYPEDLRREEFEVWNGKRALRPDVVCFGHTERQDMATAVIVAGVASGDRDRDVHIGAAQALAAPLSLLRHLDDWELWLLSDGSREEAQRVHFDASHGATLRFLAPKSLLAAKRHERQLPLFDIDVGLLDRARSMVRDSLQGRVKGAMADLLPLRGRVGRVDAEHIARVTVQAISALAVRDKLLPQQPLSAAIAWLTEHHAMQPTTPVHVAAIERVASEIGDGVNFAGLDAAILGDVYENAILHPARRSELGAFYTPPALGRKMLSLLPVEEIEPDQRSALDPTCGSGSLLLAANERLQNAMPNIEDDRARHDRARTLLFGADRDPFAVEIARLGLLLGALPYGNGYKIEQHDALVDTTIPRARMVVANPPWLFARTEGRREQLASAFLSALVEHIEPNGFLACVLPLTWLTDDTSRESREMLRNQADLFEVWRLPERVFPSAEQAACVIFARTAQKDAAQGWLAFRHFSRPALKKDNAGMTDVVLVVQDRQGTQPLIADPLADIPALSTGVTVGDVAEVFNGVPVTQITAVRRIGGKHRLLPSYGLVDELAEVEEHHLVPVQYPEGFWRSDDADPSRYLVPKVLVSATRRVDNPWRLKVFDDPLGIIPRNQMHAVVPRDHALGTRLALLAVLGSGIASAWVDPRSTSRNINQKVVAGVPMPGPEHWVQLADVADAAIHAEANERGLAIAAMEAVVWDAFDLQESDRALLRRLLGDRRAPEGVVRIAAEGADFDGDVEDTSVNVATVMDVAGDRILVHVPGVTPPRGQWIRIPADFPGWALRPGVGLEVRRLQAGLEHADWRAQAAAHLTTDEIFEMANRT